MSPKHNFTAILVIAVSLSTPLAQLHAVEDDWKSLFNGHDLTGWKANQNPESFTVENGLLKTHGLNDMAHLYYFGENDNQPEKFINFEFRCEVLVMAKSNSGIFFHTNYEKTDHFLKHGYEAQINNDPRTTKELTGSLFAVIPVLESPVRDEEWFRYYIKVDGDHIIIKVNDTITVDYREGENPVRKPFRKDRLLQKNGGALAIQAHDKDSTVYFRNIQLKKLP